MLSQFTGTLQNPASAVATVWTLLYNNKLITASYFSMYMCCRISVQFWSSCLASRRDKETGVPPPDVSEGAQCSTFTWAGFGAREGGHHGWFL